MAVHKPGVVWPTRRIGTRQAEMAQQYVRTIDAEHVEVAFHGEGYGAVGRGIGITITRADARLLARRLNQCLDETRS